MSVKNALAVATIAVLGIAAAAGMGLLANEISGDSIGLSAHPLRAGASLAPPAARAGDDRPSRSDNRGSEGVGAAAGSEQSTPTTTTETATTTAVELGDDHGGSVESGGDSSGSGSSGSGDDSSGSSGSGSDDSGFDD